MPDHKAKKMGMVQLGLLAAGALLLSGALIVKGKRDAVADTPAAIAAVQNEPAAGEPQTPPRTFGDHAVPTSEIMGEPGVSAGSEGEGISVEEAEKLQPPVMQDADCSAYQAWVGQPVDRAAIEATGKPHRILKPGDMMTMDFNPERINVETDEKGEKVQRVFCG